VHTDGQNSKEHAGWTPAGSADGVLVSLNVIGTALRSGHEWKAFLGSCGYLASMLVGAAAGLYPVLLPAVGTAGRDITIERALAGPHAVRVGLVWWTFGITLALIYTITVYWLFRGKVPEHAEGLRSLISVTMHAGNRLVR
jgi:cytochrome bd ubiquinol oxidase subunit II